MLQRNNEWPFPTEYCCAPKTSQLRILARAIFYTQDFCKEKLEGQIFNGPEYLARIAYRYGGYLEFPPDDVNLGIHLDEVAGRFRKHDMFHMGQNEAVPHLRNSYSVITNLSTFLQNLRWSTLRGQTIRVEKARDTLLSLMGNQSDAPQAG